MLCQTYINFKTFEEYLRELERGQTDEQTDRQKNRMHKHCSTLLESVKKCVKTFLFNKNIKNLMKFNKNNVPMRLGILYL